MNYEDPLYVLPFCVTYNIPHPTAEYVWWMLWGKHYVILRLVAIVLDLDTKECILALLVNNSNLFIISLLNVDVGGIQSSKSIKEKKSSYDYPSLPWWSHFIL